MDLGKSIIFIGLCLTIVGVCIYFFQYKLSWFGNLFGDFKYEKGNIKIYFPFISMIIVSIGLSFFFKIIQINNYY